MKLEENPSSSLPKPEPDALARQWNQRLSTARKHWDTLHKRMRHNRKLVSGFNWSKEPDKEDFYTLRTNLIFATVAATLPNIYARNPEISVSPLHANVDRSLFCKTLETVLNRSLADAKLKKRAKSAVLAAMVTYYGALKVTYQRDMHQDSLIMDRMNDAQSALAHLEHLMQRTQRPEEAAQHEAHHAELKQTLQALQEQVDVVSAEGIVIDKVLSENVLIDPAVCEFHDYESADWMAQLVPMKRAQAESVFKVDLRGAKPYKEANGQATEHSSRFAMPDAPASEDEQICLIEIWDKQSKRVYTLADGCDFFVREPYSPSRVGCRWYPFFLLPFAVLDGQFTAPCLVDLTEKLQREYNDTREKFVQHRDMNKPHWVASSDISEKSIERHIQTAIGEIVLLDTDGRPVNQVITPGQGIPIQPADYDTGPIRADWEQVTGLQDAARSTIVTPKTATESNIMQQALSGRIGEFRDKVEDWLQEMSIYTAQILLQELTPEQVQRYMGPPKEQMTPDGQVIEISSFDWPQMSREQVFDMVEVTIRAGTTGAPDKLQNQEGWAKALPIVQQMIMQMIQLSAQGVDIEPIKALLRETMTRFDERIDIEQFIPRPPQPAPMGMQGAPSDMPPEMSEHSLPGGPAGLPPSESPVSTFNGV
ncbi:Uncharacterized protein MCB1EB_1642 [Mycoavidus cysteinexigens]|uniref:Uncharacterized protein n=1 Tax=Mycoavidus cysteinexigens TaxID=1553431 RepID=A0A2Z6EWH5_9BURK|nr:hypothetical protein [Mycoavidus cysteinexigens]BBE09803.1 Uncharacterized protein MCB1EB_1642 [Mycoavidus cysteinexigens]GAM53853.1 hypothetical protein EBME_2316 [bacterium endosymbiont of Mortierella elongata FMR23-6]GLR01704.1 hypothetical protein GCM10007934_15160 [Mycoavidus cysteinexigens]